jgi:chromosome segregation ATPase
MGAKESKSIGARIEALETAQADHTTRIGDMEEVVTTLIDEHNTFKDDQRVLAVDINALKLKAQKHEEELADISGAYEAKGMFSNRDAQHRAAARRLDRVSTAK